MATARNREWTKNRARSLMAAFIVLCLVGIDNSLIGILRSKQSIELSQLGLTSIAPANLATAPESFILSARVEDANFPDRITRLKAWGKMRSAISDYARRLDLLETQSRELDRRLQQRMLWTAYASLACVLGSLVFSRWGRRPTPEELRQTLRLPPNTDTAP